MLQTEQASVPHGSAEAEWRGECGGVSSKKGWQTASSLLVRKDRQLKAAPLWFICDRDWLFIRAAQVGCDKFKG